MNDKLKEIRERHERQTYDKYGMLQDANDIFDDRGELLKMVDELEGVDKAQTYAV